MLTESKEKRIEEIYESHRKSWENFRNEVYNTVKLRVLILRVLFIILIPVIPPIAIILLILLPERIRRSAIMKRLKEEGFKVNVLHEEYGFFMYQPNWKRKDIGWMLYNQKIRKHNKKAYITSAHLSTEFIEYKWKTEACITKTHLKYLPMKSNTTEDEFKKFLRRPLLLPVLLREIEEVELLTIFKRVLERSKNMEIPDEHKVDFTPFEFFRNYFFCWWKHERVVYSHSQHSYSDRTRIEKVEGVYHKVLGYFKEFDKAPRISGSVVVELEDF